MAQMWSMMRFFSNGGGGQTRGKHGIFGLFERKSRGIPLMSWDFFGTLLLMEFGACQESLIATNMLLLTAGQAHFPRPIEAGCLGQAFGSLLAAKANRPELTQNGGKPIFSGNPKSQMERPLADFQWQPKKLILPIDFSVTRKR